MNEQLIVKNFGPIKDATVDFKRVTVFIGPTGGGKSTLAKLAAIFRTTDFFINAPFMRKSIFEEYGIDQYFLRAPKISWKDADGEYTMKKQFDVSPDNKLGPVLRRVVDLIESKTSRGEILRELLSQREIELATEKENPLNKKPSKINRQLVSKTFEFTSLAKPTYVPAERAFVSAIEYSWAGLMRDDIGLPKLLLDFANDFSLSKQEVLELEMPFVKAKYVHQKGQDFIRTDINASLVRLNKTASGIQSVTPLLVLLEHLSRNTEQAQSFIIEEPELNLYPTAQQGLLNWLVEKCTQGENDLTITTHSPYILSHLNLLLYAHHVGNKDEEKRRKVAAIIPEKYWVNPDEFAAYYVNGPEGAGGVRSLLDPKTKLISQNELDAVSGIQADEFDQLLDINRGF